MPIRNRRSRIQNSRVACLAFCATVFFAILAQAQPFPNADDLPRSQGLPDPLQMNNGERVATVEDWAKRRQEITDILLHYEYGHLPAAPDHLKSQVESSQSVLDGKAVLRRVTLKMGPGHKLSSTIEIYLPTESRGPFPVLVALEPVGSPEFLPIARHCIDRGFIFAGNDGREFDKDDADRSDGAHPLYPQYDWGTLAVWAWGAMRMIDYLAMCPEVDSRSIALFGHSRKGKTALLAAALDPRIALVAPHGSGAGGAGSYRTCGEGAETLDQITSPQRFHYWFQPRLRDFVGKEDRLPFDQHFLKALVAPRCIVSMEGETDHWANPRGTQVIWQATQPVYDFLGAPDKNILYVRPGGHDMTESDWLALLDYCDHFFRGKPLKSPGMRSGK